MTKFNRFYVSFLFTGLFMAYIPMTQADMQQQGYGNQVGANRTFPPVNNTDDPQQQTAMARRLVIKHSMLLPT